MAAGRGSKGGKRPASAGRRRGDAGPGAKSPGAKRSGAKPDPKKPAPKKPAPKKPAAQKPGSSGSGASREPVAPPSSTGPFRLGAVAGTTPGKWIDTWHERMPRTPLELVPVTVAGQRAALTEGEVDAALVRLPLDRDGLHAIVLYDEVPVVVCSADSHLTAVDELTIDDLAGEVVIVPADAVIDTQVPGAVPTAFAPLETTEDAIATVATGVGVVIVPMSLARLHHRKDVEYRPLRDGPGSSVALAWPATDTSPLVDTFIGIVRGRTANSSRD